jgi:zinc transporter ZupT
MTVTDSQTPRRPERVWSILTFERLVTGQVIHLVYWAGLGVIVIAAFSVVGASIGVALREGSWAAILLAIPVLIGGLLAVAAAGLVWRAMCEFYVAIFRIGDDLAALRRSQEAFEAAEARKAAKG